MLSLIRALLPVALAQKLKDNSPRRHPCVCSIVGPFASLPRSHYRSYRKQFTGKSKKLYYKLKTRRKKNRLHSPCCCNLSLLVLATTTTTTNDQPSGSESLEVAESVSALVSLSSTSMLWDTEGLDEYWLEWAFSSSFFNQGACIVLRWGAPM